MEYQESQKERKLYNLTPKYSFSLLMYKRKLSESVVVIKWNIYKALY